MFQLICHWPKSRSDRALLRTFAPTFSGSSASSPYVQNRPATHEWRPFILRSGFLNAGMPPEATPGCSDAEGQRDAESWTVPHDFLSCLHVAISDTQRRIAAGFSFNLRRGIENTLIRMHDTKTCVSPLYYGHKNWNLVRRTNQSCLLFNKICQWKRKSLKKTF